MSGQTINRTAGKDTKAGSFGNNTIDASVGNETVGGGASSDFVHISDVNDSLIRDFGNAFDGSVKCNKKRRIGPRIKFEWKLQVVILRRPTQQLTLPPKTLLG